MREKSCFPQRRKHLIIAGQHFLACLRVYLAHNCESKNCAEMLTEEGLKKAVGRMTRGLCEETGEINPTLNCVFFRGGACVHMYLAATERMGKGQATLLAQASLRGVNRSRQGPVAHTHRRIYTLAWQRPLILIPAKSYALH